MFLIRQMASHIFNNMWNIEMKYKIPDMNIPLAFSENKSRDQLFVFNVLRGIEDSHHLVRGS